MELKASPIKPEGLSPATCSSDPEEKEISDEDDDDRNHKHRRRDSHPQVVERDTLGPVFTGSYRKRNRSFENGHPFRESESQASESWKNYNMTSLGKDFTPKFEKRHPGLASLPRAPFDLNPRFRQNQTFPKEMGFGRGRARDSGSWSHCDPRFSSAGIASQMVHQCPITPNIFGVQGRSNFSNVSTASWNAFGMISGMPNGGLDSLHSIALQGSLGPAVNSSLHMGIHHQRCRDFEERGFCLRGDICPMEHGVNRIVVEDVQSLSQFDLPFSLSSAQLAGTTAEPATITSVGASSVTLTNSKGAHNKTSKAGIVDESFGLNGLFPLGVNGADSYDPDQPLWIENGPETSTGLLSPRSPKSDENESLVSVDVSGPHHVRVHGGVDDDNGIAIGSRGMNSSVWGRIRTSENKLGVKEKTDSTVNTANYLETETKGDQNALVNSRGTIHQGKKIISEGTLSKSLDSTAKMHSDTTRNTRKPCQKALRTLFVSGIPQKCNKRETLLSHFLKFGEVVDIYIPSNTERAFVQFSKREEAEAALSAPDAVMGNRFIKLWWANRDSIRDGCSSNTGNLSAITCGVTSAVPAPPSGYSRKDFVLSATPKSSVNTAAASDTSTLATDYPKTVIANDPMVPAPLQKKLESLEQLKEELRKKQEMLDQKRSDFRRQLVKLEKQATGVKGEVVVEPVAKKHRVKAAISTDVAEVTIPRFSDSGADRSSACDEVIEDKSNTLDNAVSSPKTNTAALLQQARGTKQLSHPFAPVSSGLAFPTNRYKLDNRPTAFKIMPPLPSGLATVDALREHFSSHGDISTVDVEDTETCDDDAGAPEIHKSCAARVNFTTRRSAERAFLNGNCWQGNNLKFMWLTSTTSSNESAGRENRDAGGTSVGADRLSVKLTGRIGSREASPLVNEEPEVSEKSSSDEFTSLHLSLPCPTSVAGDKELLDNERNPNLLSGVEESTKQESNPSSLSGDKYSPKGVAC